MRFKLSFVGTDVGVVKGVGAGDLRIGIIYDLGVGAELGFDIDVPGMVGIQMGNAPGVVCDLGNPSMDGGSHYPPH
jgi:hypothetical protein